MGFKFSEWFAPCRYKEPCCFRKEDGTCRILTDTKFEDGKCHFRKLSRTGCNEYDIEKGAE